MKKLILAATVATLASMSAAQADHHGALMGEAKGNAMKLGKELKATLVGAMKSGGPVAALKACNLSALGIAEKVSAESQGWTVGRTNLKYRNSNNKPDAWEEAVLKKFEERKAAGEKPNTLAYSETVEVDGKKTFRFMKAIPTAKVCLNCHGGDNVKPEIVNLLKTLYPNDMARGYKEGDLRGAFTLSKTLLIQLA